MESKFHASKIDEKRYELDVRGLVCPYPQLLVTRALSKLSPNEALEVILDNPPSVSDIPPALEGKGYKVDVSRQDNTSWRLIVQIKK